MIYIFRRLLTVIPVLLAVSFVAFGMLHLSGDPVLLMLPPDATLEQVAAFRAEYGFDDPFLQQYARFLTGALKGDLGRSIRYNEPALDLIMQRFPATLTLAGVSVLFAVLLGLPMGIFAAVRRGSSIDAAVSVLAVAGQSMPNFWLGFLLIYIFAIKLGWLPTSGGGELKNVVLPAATIAFNLMALFTRMTRSSFLEALGEDYVRTARSKGIKEFSVMTVHVARNAILPIITVVALQFGYILGGAVVVETLFAWPGLGLLTIQAIYNRDYPVTQAAVLFLAVSFVLINLVVDIICRFLDPRI